MIYVACLNKSTFFTLTRVLTLIIHQIQIKSNVLSLLCVLIFLNTSLQVVVAHIYFHYCCNGKVLISKCKQVIQMVSFNLQETFSSFVDVERKISEYTRKTYINFYRRDAKTFESAVNQRETFRD